MILIIVVIIPHRYPQELDKFVDYDFQRHSYNVSLFASNDT